MKPFILLFIFILGSHTVLFGQQRGITFQEAEAAGIRISDLDSTYQSAVHADTTKAVFKTDREQERMANAYTKLLQDFGRHLNENRFYWDKPTRCFNRIYFSPDGTIDYFLYQFSGKTADEKPSGAQQDVFKRLLNEFIAKYTLDIKANTKFAQCSPTTYLPGK